MIKQFVTILIVCFSSIECFSQNNQSTFLFPEFTEAIVHYKDGRAFQVPINYNLLESNFILVFILCVYKKMITIPGFVPVLFLIPKRFV